MIGLKTDSAKVPLNIIVILIIVTAILVIGYETFRLSVVLNEKRQLETQFDKVVRDKKSLQEQYIKSLNEKITTDFNKQLKDLQDTLLKKDTQITELNTFKETLTGQLQEANTKLTALTSANKFLEQQIEEASLSRKGLEDELNKAVNLNTSLQQNLVGLPQSITEEEQTRQKAKELKSKIEVILMPGGVKE